MFVTNHDLMLLQGTSPLSLTRDIEAQQSIEGVVSAARKINDMVTLLLKEGAKASNITRMVTEINDRLVVKLLQLAERTLGPPPLGYCWITFGSEGRREQTFKTDQDNALIYEDPRTPEQQAAAGEYFGTFAAFVNDTLVRCGFPECPGNYMARNPEWCQPLAVWRGYFSRWIGAPTEEAILRSVILFDFRPAGGNLDLGQALKAHLQHAVAGQSIFLKKMADLAVSVRPPLGFFKTFVVLRSGEHKDQLDLKKKCITPLINVVRLYSLQEGIPRRRPSRGSTPCARATRSSGSSPTNWCRRTSSSSCCGFTTSTARSRPGRRRTISSTRRNSPISRRGSSATPARPSPRSWTRPTGSTTPE